MSLKDERQLLKKILDKLSGSGSGSAQEVNEPTLGDESATGDAAADENAAGTVLQFLKAILRDVKDPTLEPVGTEQVATSATGTTPIKPTTAGASGVCRITVQNNSDVNVWVHGDAVGGEKGLKIVTNETVRFSDVDATDDKYYVHVGTVGTGNVDILIEG